jgi:hypothetical protein
MTGYFGVSPAGTARAVTEVLQVFHGRQWWQDGFCHMEWLGKFPEGLVSDCVASKPISLV